MCDNQTVKESAPAKADSLFINRSNLKDYKSSTFNCNNVRMMRSFILFDNRDFLPRPFQIELYEACKSRDTIVFLRPGNGKHFITVMLVKYFTPRSPNQLAKFDGNCGRKKIFFLAKSFNSIRFHSFIFRAHTDLTVAEYFDVNYTSRKWNKEEWIQHINHYDIHVMVDNLFEQLLKHNIVNGDIINLLILDDVHRILLSNEIDCYTRIVNKLQKSNIEQSFRILGLSASILLEDVSSIVFQTMISQIQESLNCSCETYADLRMINKYSIPCKMRLCYYLPLIHTEAVDPSKSTFKFSIFIIRNYAVQYFDFLNNLIDQKLSDQDNLVTNRLLSEVIFDTLLVYGTLGEWCTLKLIELYNRELTDTITLLKSIDSYYLNLLNCTCQTLQLIKKAIIDYLPEEIRKTFTTTTTDVSKLNKLTLKQFLSISSPKLHKLAIILKDYIDDLCHQKGVYSSFSFPANICSIIYAEKRATVRIISLWLSELALISSEQSSNNYFSYLYPDYVFLQDNSFDTKNFYYEKQQKSLHEIYYYRQQEDALKRFRFGNGCNILATTSMSAEGLDINRCNLVICFDPPRTFQQFIQNKGRVRVENGQFVVLVADHNSPDNSSYYEKFQQFIEIEKIFTKLVPINNDVQIEEKNFKSTICEQLLLSNVSIVNNKAAETKTGSIQLTMDNAISILNRYCLKLPSDTFTKLAPHYTVNSAGDGGSSYQCQLYLPINSTCRDQIVGDIVGDKSTAKRSAALNAVKRLRELGELDANYYPVGKETNRYIEKLGLQECFINTTGVDAGKNSKESGNKGNRYKRLQARNIASKRRQYYNKKVSSSLIGNCFKPCVTDSNQYYIQHLYMFQMKLTCSLPDEQNGRGRRIVDPSETTRTFGIIVPNNLPPICDYKIFNRSGEVTVTLCPIITDCTGNGMMISGEQKEKLCHFHTYTFEQVLKLGKTSIKFDCDTASNGNYLVVPIELIDGNGQIDWNFVDIIEQHFIENDKFSYQSTNKYDSENRFLFEQSLYEDTVVIPMYRRDKLQAFFYVADICHELNPLSRFPDSGFDTFEEYYRLKYSLNITNLEQPLLDVDHTSSRLNLLTPRFLNRKGITLQSSNKNNKRQNLQQRQILIPELCYIHPFPASFWRKAICLPCMLYRLNSLLVAEELRFKISKEANIGFTDLPQYVRWPSLDFGWSLIVKQMQLLKQEEKESKDVNSDIDQSVDTNTGKQLDTKDERFDLFSSMGDWNSFANTMPDNLNDTMGQFDDFELTPSIEIINNEQMGDFYTADDPSIYEIDDDDDDEEIPGNFQEDTKQAIRICSPTHFFNDKEVPAKQIDWLKYNSDSNNEDDVDVDKQFAIKLDELSNDICNLNVDDVDMKDLYPDLPEPERKVSTNESENEIVYSDFDDVDYNEDGSEEMDEDEDLLYEDDDDDNLFEEDDDDDEDNFDDDGDDDVDIIVKKKKLRKFCSKKDNNKRSKLNEVKTKSYLYDILRYELLYDCKQFEQAMLPNYYRLGEDAESFKSKVFDEIYREEKQQVLECVDTIRKQLNSNQTNHNGIILVPEKNPKNKFDTTVDDICVDKKTLFELIFDKFDEDDVDFHCTNQSDTEQERYFETTATTCESVYTSDEVKFGELLPNRENADSSSDNCDILATLPKWLQFEAHQSDFRPPNTPTPYSLGPHPSLILQAITMSNSSDGINLERLETVGDSFLKYSITAFLFCMCPDLNEGKLSFLRSRQISNINLHRLGQRINLGQLMIASKFEPGDNWCPPAYQVIDFGEKLDKDKVPYNLLTQHSIPNKSIADCVEALIGTYLISSGSQGAIKFMDWLGLKVLPKQLKCFTKSTVETTDSKVTVDCITEKWLPMPKSPLIVPNEECDLQMFTDKLKELYQKNHLNKFEEILGYKFKDKAYLVQAFTHNSYYENNITDCYQRLEFLGDAVLDYLITRYLYEDSRCHSPGTLTDLRSALVNNTFFASLAVKYNFHKYLMMLSSELYRVIDGFVRKFNLYNKDNPDQMMRMDYYDDNEDCENEESSCNYWELFIGENEAEHLEDIEVPKALGDIFESVAGAIYLDSGMSLAAVWQAYYPMMKPEIEYFSYNVPKSPIRVLLEKQPQSAKFGKPEITSGRKIRVCVEVFNVGKFVGVGRNKRIAKCIAAKRALRTLKMIEKKKLKQQRLYEY